MFLHRPPEDASYPRARCAQCERETLQHRDLDEQDRLIWRCLDCGSQTSATVSMWSAEDLAEEGYALEGWRGDATEGGCRGGHCKHS